MDGGSLQVYLKVKACNERQQGSVAQLVRARDS